MTHPVVFRIVSRGDQPGIVIATVWSVLESMQRQPLFPFEIEVVSDEPVRDLPAHPRVHADRRAARLPDIPRRHAQGAGAPLRAPDVLGAGARLGAAPRRGVPHHRRAGRRPAGGRGRGGGERAAPHRSGAHHVPPRTSGRTCVYSLADSIRVGDDMGRFHLQYRLHRILFGMHGSFVLVRTSVERQVGFDFPPEACTTEDTTWALLQMGAGNRFRWVNGTVVEQSPRIVRGLRAPAQTVVHGDVVGGEEGAGSLAIPGVPVAGDVPVDGRLDGVHVLAAAHPERRRHPGAARAGGRRDLRRLRHELRDGAVGEPLRPERRRGAQAERRTSCCRCCSSPCSP